MSTSIRTAVGSVAALALLCSCASVKVAAIVDDGAVGAAPKENVLPYYLSKTKLVVTGVVTLNDCDQTVARVTSGDSALNPDEPRINVGETFTVTPAFEPDFSHGYEIQVDKSRNWFKQVNFTVTRNANKTLVSVNGTIVDQAGPTAVAAMQAAIAIGGAVAMPVVTPFVAAREMKSASVREIAARLSPEAMKGTPFAAFAKRNGSAKLEFDTFANLIGNRDLAEATILAAVKAKGVKVPVRTPLTAAQPVYCTADVDKALFRIGQLKKTILDASKKKTFSVGKGQAAADAKGQDASPDPEITQAQSRIAALTSEAHLARSFTFEWTPTRPELRALQAETLPGRNSANECADPLVICSDVHVFGDVIAPAWLEPARRQEVLDSRDPTFRQLTKSVRLELEFAPQTLGADYVVQQHAPGSKADPDGIVYRDPATAILRACLGPCGGVLTTAALALGAAAAPADASLLHDGKMIETSNDISPATLVQVAQFGQFRIQPLTNVLFQTTAVSVTHNADGSIASMGTQSSSGLATGLTGLGTAATSQASAETARNTAVTAVNTANLNQVQYVDNVNKARADCLAQQQAILKANGQPVGSC